MDLYKFLHRLSLQNRQTWKILVIIQLPLFCAWTHTTSNLVSAITHQNPFVPCNWSTQLSPCPKRNSLNNALTFFTVDLSVIIFNISTYFSAFLHGALWILPKVIHPGSLVSSNASTTLCTCILNEWKRILTDYQPASSVICHSTTAWSASLQAVTVMENQHSCISIRCNCSLRHWLVWIYIQRAWREGKQSFDHRPTFLFFSHSQFPFAHWFNPYILYQMVSALWPTISLAATWRIIGSTQFSFQQFLACLKTCLCYILCYRTT